MDYLYDSKIDYKGFRIVLYCSEAGDFYKSQVMATDCDAELAEWISVSTVDKAFAISLAKAAINDYLSDQVVNHGRYTTITHQLGLETKPVYAVINWINGKTVYLTTIDITSNEIVSGWSEKAEEALLFNFDRANAIATVVYGYNTYGAVKKLSEVGE